MLARLNELEYGIDSGSVWLRINIDAPDRRSNDEVTTARVNRSAAIANNFVFAAGVKTVRVRRMHAGLERQWLEAWTPDADPQDGHSACVLLEDDTLPSTHAWTWTKRALSAYGHEPRLASLGWQRPTLVPATAPARRGGRLGQMPPPWRNGGAPILFKLLSTWGFVAIRRSWRCFVAWHSSRSHLATPVRFGGAPIKPEEWFSRKPAGSVWSIHFIRFAHQRGLYTLYASLRERLTLCENLRESGLNFARSAGAEFPALTNGSAEVLTMFPPFETLRAFGWDALPIAVPHTTELSEDGCPAPLPRSDHSVRSAWEEDRLQAFAQDPIDGMPPSLLSPWMLYFLPLLLATAHYRHQILSCGGTFMLLRLRYSTRR